MKQLLYFYYPMTSMLNTNC